VELHLAFELSLGSLRLCGEKIPFRRIEMGKVYYAVLPSKLLGKVFVASTGKGVCRLDFHTSENKFLKELRKNVSGEIVKSPKMNQRALFQLKKYVEGRLKRFDCRLDLQGTPFQRKVWKALLKIPYGRTRSYQDIARAIGHPKAFRAVGNANGSNPVSIIAPCHRVIESNGGLGGYGHGLKFKKRLLVFEKANAR
jgi:methylated-DNA-[protein]-cysteine S-methyltransferase